MKKLFAFYIASLFVFTSINAQIDRSQRPEPGPAPVIQLGDFESFTMDNGLRVIVVENHKVPVVSFQLTLDIDPLMEGDAKGFVDMGGSLLREGTTNRNKSEIDESIDFIGASLSTFSTGMFGSSLTRHTETLLDLMSDVLLNPSFPESELQRMVTQSITGLSTVRSDANAMARNVATAVAYGSEHPYGEIVTQESLENIDVALIKDYYNTYFRPNVAYMVIVGDINVEQAKAYMNKYFSSWEPADVPRKTYPTPQAPAGPRVAFADRAGAIQSVVTITYPFVLTPGHPDAIKASVMNSLLGGGVFSGRLMQNLREDKGYTYGARSSLGTDRLVSRFNASTEVRNSVTDSTVVEILGEMRRLINEPVTESELELIKNFMTGSFARSLESPRTIANFALNIARYDLPDDYYATYLEKLNEVTPKDVQDMAAKYLKPDNAIIVVAGNKDEVPETLKKFSASGEVEMFDAFGRPVEAPKEVGGDITAQQVIDTYIKAIGGADKIKSVNDVSQKMTMSMQGMALDVEIKQKTPNMFNFTLLMGGNVMQQQIYDGVRGVASGMGQTQELSGDDLEQMRLQATLFPEIQYEQLGYTMELAGVENIDGEDAYRLKMTNHLGKVSFDYYSVATGLKIRIQQSQATPMGEITVISDFADYQEAHGVLFPHKMMQQAGPQMIEMTINSITVNSGLTADDFKID
jgi:zinc protease